MVKNNICKTLQWLKDMDIDSHCSIMHEIPQVNGNSNMNQSQQKYNNKALDNISSLEELKHYIQNFDGCSLKHFAKNTVFGDGIANAEIMLIGEAPGATEDEKAIPFCGESGILLDNILSTIQLSRKNNVYITNTVFWRPPANRRPTDEEIAVCRPLLDKYIELINPKLIILVGSVAVSSFLNIKNSITKIRGQYYNYYNPYLKRNINVTAIFHPAYLLRQSNKKKDTWYDMLKIKKDIVDILNI